jgi:hypothetical protein
MPQMRSIGGNCSTDKTAAAYWGSSIVISEFRWGFCRGRRSVGVEGIGKS